MKTLKKIGVLLIHDEEQQGCYHLQDLYGTPEPTKPEPVERIPPSTNIQVERPESWDLTLQN